MGYVAVTNLIEILHRTRIRLIGQTEIKTIFEHRYGVGKVEEGAGSDGVFSGALYSRRTYLRCPANPSSLIGISIRDNKKDIRKYERFMRALLGPQGPRADPGHIKGIPL